MLSPQIRLLSKWQLKIVFPFRIPGAKVLLRLKGILVSLFQKCQGKAQITDLLGLFAFLNGINFR